MGQRNSKNTEIPNAEHVSSMLQKQDRKLRFQKEKSGKTSLDDARTRIVSQMRKGLTFLHSQYLTPEEANIIKRELEAKGYYVSIDLHNSNENIQFKPVQFRWELPTIQRNSTTATNFLSSTSTPSTCH